MNPLDVFRAIQDSGHDSAEKAVLLAILRRVDNDTMTGWVAQTDLGRLTSLSSKWVGAVLKRLEASGVIALVPHAGRPAGVALYPDRLAAPEPSSRVPRNPVRGLTCQPVNPVPDLRDELTGQPRNPVPIPRNPVPDTPEPSSAELPSTALGLPKNTLSLADANDGSADSVQVDDPAPADEDQGDLTPEQLAALEAMPAAALFTYGDEEEPPDERPASPASVEPGGGVPPADPVEGDGEKPPDRPAPRRSRTRKPRQAPAPGPAASGGDAAVDAAGVGDGASSVRARKRTEPPERVAARKRVTDLWGERHRAVTFDAYPWDLHLPGARSKDRRATAVILDTLRLGPEDDLGRLRTAMEDYLHAAPWPAGSKHTLSSFANAIQRWMPRKAPKRSALPVTPEPYVNPDLLPEVAHG